MNELHITLEDAESIRNAQRLSVDGEHFVDLCPLCARPGWRCTNGDKPPALHVKVGVEYCQECRGTAQRHPEVFSWIVAVLDGQRLLDKLKT